MKLKKSLRVRFGDIDYAGIVYYPRFFHYYHQFFEDFFYDYLQLQYHEVIRDEQYGLPCIHLEASFKKPLHYGAKSQIHMEIEKIGRTSITWKYQIFLFDQEPPVLASEALITTAGIHMNTFQSQEIPPILRQKLEAFQQQEGEVEL